MKTERTLMCLLFAVCSMAVIGALVVILSAHVEPVQLARFAAGLPLALPSPG